MRARKRSIVASSIFFAVVLAGAVAEAAPPSRSSTQFTLRREEAGGADANTARQRARAGDCAGALPAFDAAIRITIEPTLRRDRGLCHERLNDPYPAIDDYRAYLTARPDAPDADQIRDRLSRLEEQVGVGGPSSQQVKNQDDPASYEASGNASLSLGPGGASASSSSSSSSSRRRRRGSALGPQAGERERGFDYYAGQEKLADMADESPLRHGTGWVLGPFLNMPRYFTKLGDNLGNGPDLFFGTGLAIRYAWSPRWTFLSEIGYAGVIERGESAGGVLTFVGVEYRAPLDHYATNQLFVGGGLGYERYATAAENSIALNMLLGRARFGYRHVFGPSVALELGLDGGPAYLFATANGVTADDSVMMIGGAFAFVVGF